MPGSITLLISEYRRSMKMREVEELVDRFIYRPVAFLLVKTVYNTGITPNTLTFGAILSGISAACFYAMGSTLTRIAAAIMFTLFVILDCSDGQLARLKKNGTPEGRLLDGIADYIVITSVYIGILAGYSVMEGQPPFMLALLAGSAISIIIQEIQVDYYRTRFLDIVNDRRSTFNEGVKEYRDQYKMLMRKPGNWFMKGIIFLYLIYSGVQEKITPENKGSGYPDVSPAEYYSKNRLLIRLWLFIGPSAARTTLILCTFFNRFDIYFWITIGLFNLLAISFRVTQYLVDRKYKPVELK